MNVDQEISALLNAQGPEEDPTDEVEEPVPEELETSSEEESDQVAEEHEEAEEPEEPYYLNDFAEDTKVDISDAYELSVKMPNGFEPMTINELKNFAIDNQDLISIRESLEQERQDLEQERNRIKEQPVVSNELNLVQARKLAIQEQYNQVPWDRIRTENPAEWTARQQEFTNAFRELEAQEARVKQNDESQKKQAEYFQRQRLVEMHPELKDEKIQSETSASVEKLLREHGLSRYFDEADANLISFFIKMAKREAAAPAAKAKLKKTPPKSTSKKVRRTPTTRKVKLDRLHEAARKGGAKELDDYLNAALS